MSPALQAMKPESIPNHPLHENNPAAVIVRLQAEILRHERFDAAAAAFVAAFAAEAGFDRVSLGLLKRGYSEIVAISDQASPGPVDAQTRELAGVMDEAIEQGLTVGFPPLQAAAGVSLAHSAYSRRCATSICTVPIVVAGQSVGALSFECAVARHFEKREVENLEHVVCFVGPMLHLMWRAELPWHTRLANALRSKAAQFVQPEKRRLHIAFAAAAALLLLLLLVPVDRQVAGRARVEGVVQRVLVAPGEGFIHATHVRPGDSVKTGQLLAELADKDLQLEKRKWQSQLAQYENAYSAAAARSDRSLAAINIAKASEAQASIDLIESKLARGRVEAPFDGVVIQGDLSQSIGAPVQQGDALMTIARTDGFRVIVEIDERDIQPVRVGQQGSLALSALPWDTLPLRVTRITPVAAAVEGANVFEVEASLLEQPADVRPGLRGVAKIGAGQQALMLGWTRRVTDWARLWFWTWTG